MRYALSIIFTFYISTEIFADGSLIIIGGGKRGKDILGFIQEKVKQLKADYVCILPFASEEQDSSLYYASRQFLDLKIPVYGFVLDSSAHVISAKLDSIRKAKFIYIPGGDQMKFMRYINQNGIREAIWDAYRNGACIAGTSAGAAVISDKMITGLELKNPSTNEATERNGGFSTLEADNIQIGKGLGFLPSVIIDQHFVKRKRMNRLMTVSMENPTITCIGIDEATAIYVEKKQATVIGASAVVVLKKPKKVFKNTDGILSAQDIRLSIYTTGQTFNLK